MTSKNEKETKAKIKKLIDEGKLARNDKEIVLNVKSKGKEKIRR